MGFAKHATHVQRKRYSRCVIHATECPIQVATMTTHQKINKKKEEEKSSASEKNTYGGESALTVTTLGESAEMAKPIGTAVARNLSTLCKKIL